MNRTKYKNNHRDTHCDRLELAVPRGMKRIIKDLATQKGLSVNAYLVDLVRKDQEGMFDTMQIAEKNREKISGINGNIHDGYNVIFNDGHTIHCRTKRDVRQAIISYLTKENKCLTDDSRCLTEYI